MRMMLNVTFPNEPFNTAVCEGTVGPMIKRILEETKPEAVYFTEIDGLRGAVLIVNVDSASQIPSLSEPWFLNFDADCKFRIVMTPEDLMKSGLDELGKKWGG